MVLNRIAASIPPAVYKISAVTTITAGIYLLRDSYRGVEFDAEVDCKDKIAIVTGGNSGIGKETARELAKRGATVFILCKDMTSCTRARKEIVLSTKNKYVYARECDLGCLDSVRRFVKDFLKVEKKLDILVNNAGVWCVPNKKTKDGFETHLGVNHMGHFLLTNLLLDLLIKSAPSRIVNVSAATHAHGKINKDDLNSDKNYSKIDAYNQSKLANILFTLELAERLKGTGVTANAVNPGTCYTNLYHKNIHGFNQNLVTFLVRPFMWIFYKTASGGAQTPVYAAIHPSVQSVSGKYFQDCKEAEIAEQAKDPHTAKWLWAVSEKWTRLMFHKKYLYTDEDPPHDHNDEGNVIIST